MLNFFGLKASSTAAKQTQRVLSSTRSSGKQTQRAPSRFASLFESTKAREEREAREIQERIDREAKEKRDAAEQQRKREIEEEQRILNEKTTRMRSRVSSSQALRRSLITFNRSMKHTAIRLTKACPDSNLCMLLGNAAEPELRAFMNSFVDFRYLRAIKGIGSESANGFVVLLRYAHRKYEADVVLKSATPPLFSWKMDYTDNLMYEYRVGQFINQRLLKWVPNFLETLGLFRYTDDKQKHETQTTFKYGIKDRWMQIKPGFQRLLKPVHYNLSDGCLHRSSLALMIQSIPSAKIITDLLETEGEFEREILPIMYQIYFALVHANQRYKYMHVDFHPGNVLLYSIPNKHFLFRYVSKTGTVFEFPSKYIAKIIDYGRNYFEDGETTTPKIFEEVCTVPECAKLAVRGKSDPPDDCGRDSLGFQMWYNFVLDRAKTDLKFFYYVGELIAQKFYVGKWQKPSEGLIAENEERNLAQLIHMYTWCKLPIFVDANLESSNLESIWFKTRREIGRIKTKSYEEKRSKLFKEVKNCTDALEVIKGYLDNSLKYNYMHTLTLTLGERTSSAGTIVVHEDTDVPFQWIPAVDAAAAETPLHTSTTA